MMKLPVRESSFGSGAFGSATEASRKDFSFACQY
jgi:hypothetical protein